jgi:regulator of sigma E protease
MATALAIAAAVLAVSLLIVVHELGHLLAARRCGMRVERFSVGFGPVILSFRRGETEYAISLLPLGGYVKIRGMAPGDDVVPGDGTAYANQPAWRRFLVILAGPFMNYATAVLLAGLLLATLGLAAPDPAARVGRIQPGMPAEAAGLRRGDTILSVAGERVSTWRELVASIQRRPGTPVPLEVLRGEGPSAERLGLTVTPRDEEGVGRVGFRPHTLLERRDAGAAIFEAFHRTNQSAAAQLAAFGAVFSRSGAAGFTGPAGIAEELVYGARDGTAPFFTLVWQISVVLAILNLLPVPALDGGRLVFLAYEIVARRRVNERVENVLHVVGFVLLVGLLLGVTIFKDIPRLLGW